MMENKNQTNIQGMRKVVVLKFFSHWIFRVGFRLYQIELRYAYVEYTLNNIAI